MTKKLKILLTTTLLVVGLSVTLAGCGMFKDTIFSDTYSVCCGFSPLLIVMLFVSIWKN
ncbi:MAG: hypothetical protein JW757_11775 [Anaerolineales bacterium]|nr:hypothetical protein [Anaerolineales bacterium]